MRLTTTLAASVATLFAVALMTGCHSDHKSGMHVQTFGEPTKLAEQPPVPVSVVLADPTRYEGKFVKVAGVATEVCKEEGCWINMKDSASGKQLFVKFTCPSDGRLIPMAAEGRPVTVEGTLKIKQISEADARHYAAEGGKSDAEVAKIVGPQTQVSLSSPSASVVMP